VANEIVKVPDIGSDDPVDVIELMVAPGDSIAADDSLVVLESAKASVEVPSPLAGKVVKFLVKVGDRVNTGDDLLEIAAQGGSETTDAGPDSVPEGKASAKAAPTSEATAGKSGSEKSGSEKPASKKEETPPTAGESVMASTPARASSGAEANVSKPSTNPAITADGKASTQSPSAAVHAGPAVRKLARQLGVDLAQVTSTSGQHQRLIKEDVLAHVAAHMQQPVTGAAMAALPDVDFSQFGEVESVATSTLRRTAAKNLQLGWQHIPQVTQHELADITELEAFRREENKHHPEIKLTLLAFVAKVAVSALKKFPNFNASLSGDGNNLILKKYIHLGFAVDSDRGLLVPVLRDADKLGVRDIGQGVAALAELARTRKLQPRDMQGASFTISSLGGIGGTAFTPLVNHPQVAILGLSRADWQPVWRAETKSFEPRLMLPLSLSYDHRVIDGADAARFVVYLRDQLADLRRLVL
jgi:pyruvate dehydrogenase E2 component (dihydrolipoamide acetyltransferase)